MDQGDERRASRRRARLAERRRRKQEAEASDAGGGAGSGSDMPQPERSSTPPAVARRLPPRRARPREIEADRDASEPETEGEDVPLSATKSPNRYGGVRSGRLGSRRRRGGPDSDASSGRRDRRSASRSRSPARGGGRSAGGAESDDEEREEETVAQRLARRRAERRGRSKPRSDAGDEPSGESSGEGGGGRGRRSRSRLRQRRLRSRGRRSGREDGSGDDQSDDGGEGRRRSGGSSDGEEEEERRKEADAELEEKENEPGHRSEEEEEEEDEEAFESLTTTGGRRKGLELWLGVPVGPLLDAEWVITPMEMAGEEGKRVAAARAAERKQAERRRSGLFVPLAPPISRRTMLRAHVRAQRDGEGSVPPHAKTDEQREEEDEEDEEDERVSEDEDEDEDGRSRSRGRRSRSRGKRGRKGARTRGGDAERGEGKGAGSEGGDAEEALVAPRAGPGRLIAEDGTLAAEEDPVRPVPSVPQGPAVGPYPASSLQAPQLGVGRSKITVTGGRIVGEEQSARLDVALGTLRLASHPLFGAEEEAAQEAREAYSAYTNAVRSGDAESWRGRCAALVQRAGELEEALGKKAVLGLAAEAGMDLGASTSASQSLASGVAASTNLAGTGVGLGMAGGPSHQRQELRAVWLQTLDAFARFVDAEQRTRTTAHAVYAAWTRVKAARRRNAFTSTPLRVRARRVKRDRRLLAEASSLADYVATMVERMKGVGGVHERNRALVGRARAWVGAWREERVYALRMTEDAPVTDEEACPPAEAARRAALAGTRFAATVAIPGGRPVARVGPVPLQWPSLSVSLGHTLHLYLIERPQALHVTVHELQGGSVLERLWRRQRVASFSVPVPGHGQEALSLHGAPVLDAWFRFASPAPLAARVGTGGDAGPGEREAPITVPARTRSVQAGRWFSSLFGPSGPPPTAWRARKHVRGILHVGAQWAAVFGSGGSGDAGAEAAAGATGDGAEAVPAMRERRALLPPLGGGEAGLGSGGLASWLFSSRLVGSDHSAGREAALRAFARERDFQELVAGGAVPVDPNDPGDTRLVALRDDLRLHEVRKELWRHLEGRDRVTLLGQEAWSHQQPWRLRLLRARARSAQPVGARVPLEDGAVTGDKALQPLTSRVAEEERVGDARARQLRRAALQGARQELEAIAEAGPTKPRGRGRRRRGRGEDEEGEEEEEEEGELASDEESAIAVRRERRMEARALAASLSLAEDALKDAMVGFGGDAEGGGVEDEDEDEEPGYGFGRSRRRKGGEAAELSLVERVRIAQQGMRSTARRRPVALNEVVREGPLPDFLSSLDFSALLRLFEPRRKLRPRPRPPKAASASVPECSIFVQIVDATGVPLRVPAAMAGRTASMRRSGRRGEEEGDAGPVEDPQTFVRVRFGEETARTSAQGGAAPPWNETLTLPFAPPSGSYASYDLLQMRDEVRFSLFDELPAEQTLEAMTTLQGMGGDASSEVRFMGSFSIPFTTIYLNERVEGHFRLETPEEVLGYRAAGPRMAPGAAGAGAGLASGEAEAEDGAGCLGPSSEGTYVHVLATLDPPLPVPRTPEQESRAAGRDLAEILRWEGESEELRRHVIGFLRRLRRLRAWRGRSVTTLAPTLGGSRMLVTRFLRAQQPPPDRLARKKRGGLPAPMDTHRKVARFVSLIPFIEDWQAFEGDQDVWNTTDEFLSLRGGDWEEHAILLRNYFHWLDQEMQSGYRSYIVQGEGVPEGDTVYVLRMARGGMDAWYWNAATGRCFAKRDPSCPLRQVHALADGDNVWCNAQGSCVPDEVALDLENGSHWRALFTAKTPRSRFGELEPLNREVPEYTMPEDSRVNELREALQERLKEAVRTWRNSNARFLTSAGKHLRERLVDFEDQRLLGADVLEHDQAEVLARLGASDGFGFPLCMPFTDVQGVVEAIKNTAIHQTTLSRVQFGIAVELVPYPCGVLAVWVYMATVVRNRI